MLSVIISASGVHIISYYPEFKKGWKETDIPFQCSNNHNVIILKPDNGFQEI